MPRGGSHAGDCGPATSSGSADSRPGRLGEELAYGSARYALLAVAEQHLY